MKDIMQGLLKDIGKLPAEIDSLIRRGISFFAFRTPHGDDKIQFGIQTEGSIRLCYDIEELNGQKGFVITPFKAGKNCPIVLIQPDVEFQVGLSSRYELSNIEPSGIEPLPTPTYKASFDYFIDALRNEQFDKLVLSRSQSLRVASDFSLTDSFFKACMTYIHSYVYLCYTPYTGVWLGGTPEIILSGKNNQWSTVALAGTLPLQNGQLPQEWDEKNRKEQGYVASYVRDQLRSFGIQPVESGPYPAYAGALSHLKTDFHFSLPDGQRLGTLLKLLHPTPAVCGLPKEEAYQFILDNEKYDRRYYSGFIGKLDPKDTTDLYVNLRCMNVESDKLTLYAGGGLLASSKLEDEWQETENKMFTMLRLVES